MLLVSVWIKAVHTWQLLASVSSEKGNLFFGNGNTEGEVIALILIFKVADLASPMWSKIVGMSFFSTR